MLACLISPTCSFTNQPWCITTTSATAARITWQRPQATRWATTLGSRTTARHLQPITRARLTQTTLCPGGPCELTVTVSRVFQRLSLTLPFSAPSNFSCCSMGTGYDNSVSQWSKGEYPNANNFQGGMAPSKTSQQKRILQQPVSCLTAVPSSHLQQTMWPSSRAIWACALMRLAIPVVRQQR